MATSSIYETSSADRRDAACALTTAPLTARAALTDWQVSSSQHSEGLQRRRCHDRGRKGHSAGCPHKTPTAVPTFTRDLNFGLSGPDVSALQQFLKQQGYYTYPEITGYFGAITKAAVAAFQQAHGIAPLGGVGPQTRAAILALLTSLPPPPLAATATTTATTTSSGHGSASHTSVPARAHPPAHQHQRSPGHPDLGQCYRSNRLRN